MLPDEFKHSQDDDPTSGTSGPNPGVVAPAPEPSYPLWARPESVSLEYGISPHGLGYNVPGAPPFPPFPVFPAQFPYFGRHHHGGPPPPPPPPPPPGPPGPPGEHPNPPLPPPPPPAPAQDPLGSFGPWRDYLENIASWSQQAVNAYSGVGEDAHGHHGHHLSHFGPRRGGRRGHHHEGGSDGEGPAHRGRGGPGGLWGPRRGGWGPHRGRGGRCGHREPPHHGFIHPGMDIISSDDAYTVTIELPGLRKDDVEISVHGPVLTISGEFKPDTGVPMPPAPSPDPEGYPIEYIKDEKDSFSDIDDNIEKKRKDSAILKERRVGKFKRSIDLPSWVDAEKGIKASVADGVLTIVFNKGPESKAKKVNIL